MLKELIEFKYVFFFFNILCFYLKHIHFTAEYYLMIQIFLKLYVANEDHSTCSFPVIVVVTSIYIIKHHSSQIQSWKIHENSSFELPVISFTHTLVSRSTSNICMWCYLCSCN